MALLAVTDLCVKLAAQTLPVGQIMLLLTLGVTALFCLIARAQRAPLISRAALHPMVLWRNLFEIVGGIGLVLGTAYVPLSILAAIMQAAPLVVTMGAALVLKEQVGPRRWAAIGVGMFGMLLVVRPGMEGFTPAALWAVLGVVALAMRDIVTRLCPKGIPSISLSAWGFIATIPVATAMLLLMDQPMQADRGGLLALGVAVLVTTVGYYSVTTAMRAAPASVVSPFRYTRLLFTMGLGITVLGERPDGLTLTGAAIILAAGLYTFVREHRLARAARRQAEAAKAP